MLLHPIAQGSKKMFCRDAMEWCDRMRMSFISLRFLDWIIHVHFLNSLWIIFFNCGLLLLFESIYHLTLFETNFLHPPPFFFPFTTNWYSNLFTDEKHALHMLHIYVCEKIDLIDFFNTFCIIFCNLWPSSWLLNES